MKILKLHKIVTNSKEITRETPILLNPLEIITVEDYSFSNGHKGARITYKKDMVDGMYVLETLAYIYNLINNDKIYIKR